MAETDLGGLMGPSTSTSTSTSSRFSEPTQEMQQLLTLITGQQFPSRMGGWMDVLTSLLQRANASPQALSALTSPQLQQQAQQLQETQRGLSQAMGPWSGAQLPAAMGRAAAGQPWLGTQLGPLQQALQNLTKFTGGTSLLVPSAQTSSGTSQGTNTAQAATNPNEWAQALQGLAFTGAGLANAFQRPSMGRGQGLELLLP